MCAGWTAHRDQEARRPDRLRDRRQGHHRRVVRRTRRGGRRSHRHHRRDHRCSADAAHRQDASTDRWSAHCRRHHRCCAAAWDRGHPCPAGAGSACRWKRWGRRRGAAGSDVRSVTRARPNGRQGHRHRAPQGGRVGGEDELPLVGREVTAASRDVDHPQPGRSEAVSPVSAAEPTVACRWNGSPCDAPRARARAAAGARSQSQARSRSVLGPQGRSECPAPARLGLPAPLRRVPPVPRPDGSGARPPEPVRAQARAQATPRARASAQVRVRAATARRRPARVARQVPRAPPALRALPSSPPPSSPPPSWPPLSWPAPSSALRAAGLDGCRVDRPCAGRGRPAPLGCSTSGSSPRCPTARTGRAAPCSSVRALWPARGLWGSWAKRFPRLVESASANRTVCAP